MSFKLWRRQMDALGRAPGGRDQTSGPSASASLARTRAAAARARRRRHNGQLGAGRAHTSGSLGRRAHRFAHGLLMGSRRSPASVGFRAPGRRRLFCRCGRRRAASRAAVGILVPTTSPRWPPVVSRSREAGRRLWCALGAGRHAFLTDVFGFKCNCHKNCGAPFGQHKHKHKLNHEHTITPLDHSQSVNF